MPKRLTPIERAIAGSSGDRRQRYAARMRQKGFTRTSLMVREDMVPLVKRVAEMSRTLSPEAFERYLKELPGFQDNDAGTERPQRSEDAPRRRRPRQARG